MRRSRAKQAGRHVRHEDGGMKIGAEIEGRHFKGTGKELQMKTQTALQVICGSGGQ